VRDDQVRRYARHILLPDVGGVGQRALLAATVAVDVASSAGRIAATFLAAGGVGTLAIGATDPAERARLASLNPDTQIVETAPAAITAPVLAVPGWWPAAEGDTTARAWWAGAMAAVECMHGIVTGERDGR